VLEYYEGIIILTTNRITSLDVAVQSRIHLAIQYHDLKPRQKEKIFAYFLDEVIGEDRIAGRDEIDRMIPKLVKKSRINGRQIRNILMSALLLAQSQGRGGGKTLLRLEHIEEVLTATEDFMESLKDLTIKKRELNEAASIL
jgi:AAA+ superfamily predicted ATPase